MGGTSVVASNLEVSLVAKLLKMVGQVRGTVDHRLTTDHKRVQRCTGQGQRALPVAMALERSGQYTPSDMSQRAKALIQWS